MIEAEQEALLVVARHPRLSVGQYHVFRYVSRFGKVNEPSADLGVVVNNQNTATHNLEKKKISFKKTRSLFKITMCLRDEWRRHLPHEF